MQHMLLFLEVAKNEIERQEWGVVEIGTRLDMPQASVSRAITDLSARTIPPGSAVAIDLLTTRPDMRDHRKRIPALTAKGWAVYERLRQFMAKACA